MDIDSQKSNPAPPVFAFDPSTGYFIPKGTFDALPEELKVSTVPPNGNNKFGFPNYCLCCGLWFKRKHKCNRSNHPAAKGKYTFTLPADLLDTLRGGRANLAASCDALKVNKNFVKSVDWDFSLFLEITPVEMFSPPGTIQSLTSKKTRSSFALLVKDVAQFALSRKPGALEVALLLLPRLVAPSNLRGRTATSKIL